MQAYYIFITYGAHGDCGKRAKLGLIDTAALKGQFVK